MTDRQEPLPPTIEVEGRDGVKHRVWDLSARQEAADTSGLRAALEARIAHWRDVVKVQPMARTTLKAVLATIDAVLSQGPTPDERPLDVDALARLLHEYEKVKGHPGCGWKFDSTMPDGTPLCPCRGYAARLSAAGE